MDVISFVIVFVLKVMSLEHGVAFQSRKNRRFFFGQKKEDKKSAAWVIAVPLFLSLNLSDVERMVEAQISDEHIPSTVSPPWLHFWDEV